MKRLGLILLLGALGQSHLGASWSWHGSSGAVWHGNVTNSDRTGDRLSALNWQTALTGNFHRPLPRGSALTAGLRLGFDLWPEFQRLDSLTLGPSIGLSHKFGLGDRAWVISANTSGSWVGVRESPRSGLAGELQLEARKRWSDSWQFFLGFERRRYDARGRAFSHSGRESYLRAEYQLNAGWSASLELRQRAGIVVSYTTPPRPDLVQAGKILTLVDTFERDTPLLAYYFPADTRIASFDLTRSLGRATAAYLQFEYAETTHNALRYLNQRTSVGLVRRF